MSIRFLYQSTAIGSSSSLSILTSVDVRYLNVRPGNPMIIANEPSLRGLEETGKNFCGWKGTLSFEYFECFPSGATYARRKAKSPVCRGHIQLSVSPPYTPMEPGGAYTSLT